MVGIMKRDSKISEIIKIVVISVVIVAVVKLFWTVVSLYLPVEGVDAEPVQSGGKLYYRYRLASSVKKEYSKKVNHPKKRRDTIRDLKLIAVYHDSKNNIAVVQYRGKSVVMVEGDTISGFTLKQVDIDSAIFVRGDKEYQLKLPQKDIRGYEESHTHISNRDSIDRKKYKIDKKRYENSNKVQVERENIDNYMQNMDKIWKDISISDIRKNGKIDGFRVRYIRRGSMFEKLGLKRGDKIIAVNGEEIRDYSVPMKIFKNLNDIDSLSLTVERRGKRVELNYEIQ